MVKRKKLSSAPVEALHPNQGNDTFWVRKGLVSVLFTFCTTSHLRRDRTKKVCFRLQPKHVLGYPLKEVRYERSG